MRRAASGNPEATLRMVSGRKDRSRSLYRRKDAITDNAPRGSFPTSLLNHETSDHLLSRLKAMPAVSPPGQARVDRWPVLNVRSEERRVGKECSSRWWACH